MGERTDAAGTGGKVLLVDDDEALRTAFLRALRRAGHDVTVAKTGREAAEVLSGRPVELVVSDVRMPHMDGIELLRVGRELDPDLSVLLMSGTPDLQTAMKAVEYGAFVYLIKPVDLPKLEATVARAIASF